MEKKGRRLTSILRKVELMHLQHPIVPARKDGYVVRETGESIDSIQTGWEHGNRPIRDNNRQILGDFYEFMTAGIYGGVIRKNIEVAKSVFVEPDVLNEETRQGFEAKAVHSSEPLKLGDHQIQRYHILQFHMQDYYFYFVVYRHTLAGLRDYEEETLSPELSTRTLGSIVIPLSLVTHMHSLRNNYFVYRYDGEKWCPNTVIRSYTLNRFFGSPRRGSEKEIVEELGANPDDYKFQRLMSPTSFEIRGNRIKQFPVMMISDKSHKEWIDWFLENVHIQEEIPFSQNGDMSFGNENNESDEVPFEVEIVNGYDVVKGGCSDKEEVIEAPVDQNDIHF